MPRSPFRKESDALSRSERGARRKRVPIDKASQLDDRFVEQGGAPSEGKELAIRLGEGLRRLREDYELISTCGSDLRDLLDMVEESHTILQDLRAVRDEGDASTSDLERMKDRFTRHVSDKLERCVGDLLSLASGSDEGGELKDRFEALKRQAVETLAKLSLPERSAQVEKGIEWVEGTRNLISRLQTAVTAIMTSALRESHETLSLLWAWASVYSETADKYLEQGHIDKKKQAERIRALDRSARWQ